MLERKQLKSRSHGVRYRRTYVLNNRKYGIKQKQKRFNVVFEGTSESY